MIYICSILFCVLWIQSGGTTRYLKGFGAQKTWMNMVLRGAPSPWNKQIWTVWKMVCQFHKVWTWFLGFFSGLDVENKWFLPISQHISTPHHPEMIKFRRKTLKQIQYFRHDFLSHTHLHQHGPPNALWISIFCAECSWWTYPSLYCGIVCIINRCFFLKNSHRHWKSQKGQWNLMNLLEPPCQFSYIPKTALNDISAVHSDTQELSAGTFSALVTGLFGPINSDKRIGPLLLTFYGSFT